MVEVNVETDPACSKGFLMLSNQFLANETRLSESTFGIVFDIEGFALIFESDIDGETNLSDASLS